jgi:hypothetical protein
MNSLNACAFKEFIHPLSVLPYSTASWSMRVIYTSKGAMRMLGCALSIEKYGKYIQCAYFLQLNYDISRW